MSNPFNTETMLELYSSQLLISSTLGLMLAGEKKGEQQRNRKALCAGKIALAFLLGLKTCLLLTEKPVSPVSPMAGCGLCLSQERWLSIRAVVCSPCLEISPYASAIELSGS